MSMSFSLANNLLKIVANELIEVEKAKLNEAMVIFQNIAKGSLEGLESIYDGTVCEQIRSLQTKPDSAAALLSDRSFKSELVKPLITPIMMHALRILEATKAPLHPNTHAFLLEKAHAFGIQEGFPSLTVRDADTRPTAQEMRLISTLSYLQTEVLREQVSCLTLHVVPEAYQQKCAKHVEILGFSQTSHPNCAESPEQFSLLHQALHGIKDCQADTVFDAYDKLVRLQATELVFPAIDPKGIVLSEAQLKKEIADAYPTVMGSVENQAMAMRMVASLGLIKDDILDLAAIKDTQKALEANSSRGLLDKLNKQISEWEDLPNNEMNRDLKTAASELRSVLNGCFSFDAAQTKFKEKLEQLQGAAEDKTFAKFQLTNLLRLLQKSAMTPPKDPHSECPVMKFVFSCPAPRPNVDMVHKRMFCLMEFLTDEIQVHKTLRRMAMLTIASEPGDIAEITESVYELNPFKYAAENAGTAKAIAQPAAFPWDDADGSNVPPRVTERLLEKLNKKFCRQFADTVHTIFDQHRDTATIGETLAKLDVVATTVREGKDFKVDQIENALTEILVELGQKATELPEGKEAALRQLSGVCKMFTRMGLGRFETREESYVGLGLVSELMSLDTESGRAFKAAIGVQTHTDGKYHPEAFGDFRSIVWRLDDEPTLKESFHAVLKEWLTQYENRLDQQQNASHKKMYNMVRRLQTLRDHGAGHVMLASLMSEKSAHTAFSHLEGPALRFVLRCFDIHTSHRELVENPQCTETIQGDTKETLSADIDGVGDKGLESGDFAGWSDLGKRYGLRVYFENGRVYFSIVSENREKPLAAPLQKFVQGFLKFIKDQAPIASQLDMGLGLSALQYEKLASDFISGKHDDHIKERERFLLESLQPAINFILMDQVQIGEDGRFVQTTLGPGTSFVALRNGMDPSNIFRFAAMSPPEMFQDAAQFTSQGGNNLRHSTDDEAAAQLLELGMGVQQAIDCADTSPQQATAKKLLSILNTQSKEKQQAFLRAETLPVLQMIRNGLVKHEDVEHQSEQSAYLDELEKALRDSEHLIGAETLHAALEQLRNPFFLTQHSMDPQDVTSHYATLMKTMGLLDQARKYTGQSSVRPGVRPSVDVSRIMGQLSTTGLLKPAEEEPQLTALDDLRAISFSLMLMLSGFLVSAVNGILPVLLHLQKHPQDREAFTIIMNKTEGLTVDELRLQILMKEVWNLLQINNTDHAIKRLELKAESIGSVLTEANGQKSTPSHSPTLDGRRSSDGASPSDVDLKQKSVLEKLKVFVQFPMALLTGLMNQYSDTEALRFTETEAHLHKSRRAAHDMIQSTLTGGCTVEEAQLGIEALVRLNEVPYA